MCIYVDGDEKISIRRVGDLSPFGQTYIIVRAAGQDYRHFRIGSVDQAAQFLCDVKSYIFLFQGFAALVLACAAAILAAVTGVDAYSIQFMRVRPLGVANGQKWHQSCK